MWAKDCESFHKTSRECPSHEMAREGWDDCDKTLKKANTLEGPEKEKASISWGMERHNADPWSPMQGLVQGEVCHKHVPTRMLIPSVHSSCDFSRICRQILNRQIHLAVLRTGWPLIPWKQVSAPTKEHAVRTISGESQLDLFCDVLSCHFACIAVWKNSTKRKRWLWEHRYQDL